MENLVLKYQDKLIQAGLAQKTAPPVIGGLDHELVWNRPAPEAKTLAAIFQAMAINSLVFFRPAPPYDRIMGFLADQALTAGRPILPMDCETRTFLHDLPVVKTFSVKQIVPMLRQRKGVIVRDKESVPAVIAHGTVSPEQGFVTASSILFACFVKFFSDYLFLLQKGGVPAGMHRTMEEIRPLIDRPAQDLPELAKGPFQTEEAVYEAMVAAGRKTVEYGLVDSYFGNISYCRSNILFISQTGSSLDELSGCIDPVPMDHSSSAGLTASSELSAHMETIERTGADAILHGHPKFSVILSMDCSPEEKQHCRFNTRCHTHCPKKRSVLNVPVVPGEVGTGPTGLCNTLPPAFESSPSVIVYGHGLFTLGKNDFTQAFERLFSVETQCRQHYFAKVDKLNKT